MSRDFSPMWGSARDDWRTPASLFAAVCQEFPITLDTCANRDNTMCRFYLDKSINALNVMWDCPARMRDRDANHALVRWEDRGLNRHETVWMNPPYGKNIIHWMRHAMEQSRRGLTVVSLVPARTDTTWWWTTARHCEVRFLRGRLRFDNSKQGAPFPAALVIMHKGRIEPITRYIEEIPLYESA